MDNILNLDNGKVIRFTCMSAREVFLKHHSLSNIKVKKNDEGEIIKLIVDDQIYENGSILQLKLYDSHVRPFKINYIKKSKHDNMYVLYSSVLTKATKWVMPMLRITNETQANMRYSTNFINCYVGTKEEGYLDNIYLVYRYSGDLLYKQFEEQLKNHDLFERMIDIDKHHIMYIFNMTLKDKQNFEKFKQGKYSKFTDEYKKKILDFVINFDLISEDTLKSTITYGILYRTDKQIKEVYNLIGDTEVDIKKEKLEVLSIPDEMKEVYTGDIEIPDMGINYINQDENFKEEL